MISASALILNGMHGRNTSLNHRLRDMSRERLKLLDSDIEDSLYKQERLDYIDTELPIMLDHYVQVHQAIMFMYLAVMLYVVNMFMRSDRIPNSKCCDTPSELKKRDRISCISLFLNRDSNITSSFNS